MQENDIYDRLQKLERIQRIIAIIYIVTGFSITSVMTIAFFWPDEIFGSLPDINWTKGAGVLDLPLNILQGFFYGLFWIGLFFLILAIRILAVPIALLIGIPTLIGGIVLLKNRKYGFRIILFPTILFLFVFPLGTLLAFFTFRLQYQFSNIPLAR